MEWQVLLLAMVVAFWVGALPFGYWIGRLRGVDVRKVGSGNIGATNVFRTLGAKAGLTVLFLDALKGWLPTFVVMRLAQGDSFAGVLVGVAAIAGHLFSPFLGFKGGKGIATGLGALLALSPKLIAVVLPVWAIVFLLTRWVSLASIVAAALVPFVSAYLELSPYATAILAVAAAIVVWKHRSNIRRILKGEEPKLELRKRPPSLEQACVELARQAVERIVLEGTRIEPNLAQLPRELRVPGSVFVAIYQDGEVRALMGSLTPEKPTRAHEIVYQAVRAAILDTRYPPIEAHELPTLRYVVYLVESYEPLGEVLQVDPQRDGVLVEWQGEHVALVPPLPDVRTPEEQIALAYARGGIPREASARVYRVRLQRLG
ncbi:MAG: glycerol-3-phosphate 1-O-acyltransferase PlsY [Fimbriimonadales bacterium]